VLFLQLETVAKIYLDTRRKTRRVKRQKTCEEDSTAPSHEEYDLQSVLKNEANNLVPVPSITSEVLINIIKQNIKDFANTSTALDEDEVDGSTTSLCLTKAVIDAFSQNNVIEQVKQNLFTQLSKSL
jgi:hypothetical protein